MLTEIQTEVPRTATKTLEQMREDLLKAAMPKGNDPSPDRKTEAKQTEAKPEAEAKAPKRKPVEQGEAKPGGEAKAEADGKAEAQAADANAEVSSEVREAWLLKAAEKIGAHIKTKASRIIPEFRVSMGWPAGSRGTQKFVAQVMRGNETSDNMPQVFITPVCRGSLDALDLLTQAMLRVLPKQGAFAAHAEKIGMCPGDPNELLGPAWTSKPGSDLEKLYMQIIGDLGNFPHKPVNPDDREKQETRTFKVHCAVDGAKAYKARITQVWLDKFGAPYCGCHNQRMLIED